MRNQIVDYFVSSKPGLGLYQGKDSLPNTTVHIGKVHHATYTRCSQKRTAAKGLKWKIRPMMRNIQWF